MNKNLVFIAAPLLTVVYGVIRLLDGRDGERGPGLAWTSGHLAFLVGVGLFAVALWEMRRRAGSGTLATATAVVALVGAGCLVAQFGIDIVVGALAEDHAAMGSMSETVSGVPGVELAVYALGPILFYVGLMVAACHLAAVGELPAWGAGLVVLSVLTAFAGNDLIPVAGLLLAAGLAPLARSPRGSVTLAA
ncbi:hypothetical protein EDD29_5873 [Actinocorallia herbida]|uniref:Uncharacterized protein n=1 Tax=Actinocorallia herbida TaxID=58109 RepID=A0A3N1D3V3_9ACTN|nr:hypothetical protein [Actinocorallia herbida]ROO88211.1 hypothetical protein EDD29_5873 [Actinocorallia herbida]